MSQTFNTFQSITSGKLYIQALERYSDDFAIRFTGPEDAFHERKIEA